jgi:hypothetical protein
MFFGFFVAKLSGSYQAILCKAESRLLWHFMLNVVLAIFLLLHNVGFDIVRQLLRMKLLPFKPPLTPAPPLKTFPINAFFLQGRVSGRSQRRRGLLPVPSSSGKQRPILNFTPGGKL